MPDDSITSRKRLLEPMDRAAEVLCGLIMVLTFTLTLNRAETGRESVREMLLAALGCNLAWGIIDGALYVMGCMSERGKNILSLKILRETADSEKAYQVISDALPPQVAGVLGPAEFELLRQRLSRLADLPTNSSPTKEDWYGGGGVLLLVFLSTFPVAIPFLFMSDVACALRTSNAIAIGLLFLTGFFFGRATGGNPWRTGIFTLCVGSLLAGVALVFGG